MSAITFANSSQFHDTFVGKVIHHEPAYVEIHAKDGKTTYAISDHIDARINDYTFDTFQKIEHEIQNETDAYKLMEWKEVAEMVYVNYKIQQKDDHPNWLQRLVTKLLTTLHITHTQDEVEKEFHQLEHLLEDRYQQKPHVQTYLESYQYMQQKLEERIDRREAHRKPDAALVAKYDENALTNVFISKRVKEMTEKSPEVKQFDALIKEQKTLEGRIKEIQGGTPEKELGELAKAQQRLQEIVRQDPYAKKQIEVAHIKERATLEVYEQELPKRIKEGCYDPAVIPDEIKLVLGVGDAIPSGIKDIEDVKNHIHDELKRFKAEGKINKHQLKYVHHEIEDIADRYRAVYPGKSLEDALVFARDLARVAVYQEIFDKSSFSGSDHGAKHIHNNIDNANKLHRHMDANDYSRKDKFLEHVIHFYHDIGYTTGMATRNFSASKDHPLIGAKIIEEQKPYFEKYLDAESYDILHKCVLYHAIALPNLTHTEEKQGAHYEMIRAVTSISDACAVTYDRKTQEFWEQPQAVRALARLKFFLVQFPQYQASLSSDRIATNEWHGLNKDEPMDRMAHDVFQGVKQELRDLVNSADISEDKKDLFRQAIEQQFNGFTANVTLGQYGGVLTDVDVVVNPNGMARGGEGPKYQPKFVLAPSLVYGVLNDLFGADQANRAFKALCEEFGGDVKDIQGSLVSMAKAMQNKEAVQPRTVVTGNAVMEIAPNYEIDLDTHKHYEHLEEMQAGLARVTSELVDVYGSAEIGLEAKMNLFNQFQDVRKEKTPLDVFMRESIQPFMSMYTGARQEDTRALLQDPQFKQQMETIQKMDRELSQVPEKERTQKAREADLLYERLCGRIKLIILSDTELGFMAGTVHKEERLAVGG